MREELDRLIRSEFGLGAAESPRRVYHCRDPRLPQFEFEWHPGAQKVYRIDLPDLETARATGHCIAEHCLTHGQFLGFVQTFCRGYLLAVAHHEKKETDPCPTR